MLCQRKNRFVVWWQIHGPSHVAFPKLFERQDIADDRHEVNRNRWRPLVWRHTVSTEGACDLIEMINLRKDTGHVRVENRAIVPPPIAKGT